MSPFALVAPLVAALLLAAPARANDSTTALGAGGLTLTESADIRMASEDLFISKDEIRVAYSFVNESGAPISTRVAFPLPEADMSQLGDVDLNWPTDDPANAIGFVVKVDGRQVKTELEHKAFFKGEDVTELLLRMGAPLGYPQHGFAEKLMTISAADKRELARRGMADFVGDYPRAMWTVKDTFHWQQTFPSDRPLHVEHTYKPVVGGSFLASGEFPESYRKSEFFKNFCIDRGTEAAIVRRLKTAGTHAGSTGLLLSWYIDYVLTTGRNWKGPIGRFRLTVDKGKPDNIVFFCATNLRKIGATTFVSELDDFEPNEDLHIMIVEPMPPEASQ